MEEDHRGSDRPPEAVEGDRSCPSQEIRDALEQLLVVKGERLHKSGRNIQQLVEHRLYDFNLLDIDFYLEYRVSDPVAYLYASDNPEEILKNIALSSIRAIVADYTVDELLDVISVFPQDVLYSEAGVI